MPTGGRLQCAGHWDYYASYMVWTKHFAHAPTRHRVVPYNHCAPEVLVR